LDPGRVTARALWVVVESVHAVTYFAPAALQPLREAGLKGFWAGYFAARSAPLGAVAAAPVAAAFFNFDPAMVRRAVPSCWAVIDPRRSRRLSAPCPSCAAPWRVARERDGR